MTGARRGKGTRRSRHEWRSLLAKFDESGLGVEAFCRREAISVASLYRWRGVFSAIGDEGNKGDGIRALINPQPEFVDLGTLSSAATSRIDLKLELGEGWVLHLVRH